MRLPVCQSVTGMALSWQLWLVLGLPQVGDTFVLNCLDKGNYSPLMKHFLKRFPRRSVTQHNTRCCAVLYVYCTVV